MEHSGYLIAQDTFYVGNMKGVGRIYQQTVIDTYSKVAFTKLYDRKNALVAADMLRIVSFPSLTAKRFRPCVFGQIADLNIVVIGNIMNMSFIST